MTKSWGLLSLKSIFSAYLSVSLCLLICANALSAQQVNNQLLKLQVKEQSLGEILDQLFVNHQIKVAFNASDPAFDQVVSYDLKANSPEQLLESLLNQRGYRFKKIGDQYIVFKHGEPEPREIISQTDVTESLPKTVNDTIFINKNVLRLDTIVRTDTLIRIDTVIIRDTITVFKEPVEHKKTRRKGVRSDIFNQSARKQQGHAVEMFYGRALTIVQFEVEQQSNSILKDYWQEAVNPGFRAQTLGLKYHFNAKKWSFTSGIALTGFAEKFDYKRKISVGGFFDIDTLDTYYSIANMDTTWFHVTDSSWIPLDERTFDYSGTNKMGYLNWDFAVAYEIMSFSGVRLFAKAGAGMSVLVYKSGTAISATPDYDAISMKDFEMETLKFSWMLGLNARMRLSDAFDLVPEIYFRKFGGDVYKNYPVQRKQSMFGVNLGLIYYF